MPSTGRGYSIFSTAAAAAKTSVESATAVARTSVSSAAAAVRSSVDTASCKTWKRPADCLEQGNAAPPRIAYAAVGRNEDMLAEAADPEEPDVARDFAIALGRKLLRRRSLPGWDEISSGRHHALCLPIHDLCGCTSYIICFSHSFPIDQAQAFLQKLSFMLDPVIEKTSALTEQLLESTVLVVLPVVERELSRGNSGVKTHQIEKQVQEVKATIENNIEVILSRDEKLIEGNAKGSSQIDNVNVFVRKKTRSLARMHLMSQVKWTPTLRRHIEMRTQLDCGQPRKYDVHAEQEEESNTPTDTGGVDTDGVDAGGADAGGADAGGVGAEQQKLEVGCRVRIHNLQNAVELNGESGTLEEFVGVSQRWRVRIDSGCVRDLKSENIQWVSMKAQQGCDDGGGVKGAGSQPRLEPGVKVWIHGLRSATHLNGQGGVVEEHVAVSHRWRVRLDEGGSKDLKQENMTMEQPNRKDVHNVTGVQSRPAKPSEARSTQKPAQSPSEKAQALIGSRMSAEQTVRAAELIISLEPFVNGTRRASQGEIWKIFGVSDPPRGFFRETDEVAKTLRTKLNRQRLLLHPDKNSHPDAERTFKFLEQCNQKLLASCVSHDGRSRESVVQRTKREERELHEENERRRRQEDEWAASEEKRRREEEARLREEAERAEREEMERQRLERLLRDKEALGQHQAERAARRRVVTQPTESGSNQEDAVTSNEQVPEEPGPVQPTPSISSTIRDDKGDVHSGDGGLEGPPELVGKLVVTILAAKDLPSNGFFVATNVYADVRVGRQRLLTPAVSGRNPAWSATFEIPIHMQDRSLHVLLWREGWGFRLLGDEFIGSVEIPFLDLEDWAGCVIGRMIEAADPEVTECMTLELRASIEWL